MTAARPARMATTLQWDADEMIAIDIAPAHQYALSAALERAGVPYEWRGNTLITYNAAETLVDQEIGPQSSLAAWDVLRRQQGHRSTITDAAGFVVALAVIGGVLYIAARFPVGDAARAVFVFVAGLLVTLLISERVIGPRDPRRGMFVAGMMGLFLAGAMWFACKAWGIL